jgi:REP element-mobilizing transposase RayT
MADSIALKCQYLQESINKIMSSYRQIFYQIIFGTKDREPTIDEANCRNLYQYISGIIKNNNCKLYRINGVEDHLHIFSDLHPTICLSDYIKDIKVASSLWMKEKSRFPKFKAWQVGYGAFTYSIREKEMIINYVENQKEHHRVENFYDEFKRLLIENGIEFDEKYLL